MGLFNKPGYLPHQSRKSKHFIHDVGSSDARIAPGETAPSENSAHGGQALVDTEFVRAQLSQLFSSRDRTLSDEDEKLGLFDDPNPPPQRPRQTKLSSPRHAFRKSNPETRTHPQIPSLSGPIGGLESSSLEELTPISYASLGQGAFPDASKYGKGTDLGLWSGHSPVKNSPSSKGLTSRQGFQSTSSSPGNRRAVLGRTNSISRLARRASLKRKSSLVKQGNPDSAKSANDCETSLGELSSSGCGHRGTLTPPSPVAATKQASLRKLEVKAAPLLSASPTTPHVDSPQNSSPLGVVSGALQLEPYNELAKGQTNSIEPKQPQGRSTADRCQQHQRPESNRRASLPEVEAVSQTSDLLGDEGPAWDKLEIDDFADADVFGLEAATANDFVASSDIGDQLNNTPASGVCDLPFGVTSASEDPDTSEDKSEPNSLLAPPEKAHEDASVRLHAAPSRGVDIGAHTGGKLFGGSKPAKKMRKRPPPLLTPEPKSDGSGPSTKSPSTGVFGSNGDFTTGGFRITSEGMVGKPERVTRMDSDDAPSTGCAPETVRDLSLVRSLAELRKGPTLGMGAAGRVYLAIHEPSGKSMAMKVVNVYDEAKRNQLLKELDTLSSHVSRFLVRFYGAFYDGKGAVHIALEFMDAGCLSSTVQKFGAIPEPVTRMIAADALRALRFLHRHNVLHRDFKTANILLSRRTLCAKVSDFGLARDMDAGVSRVDTFVGTVAYMSPERLNGSKYTYASDIWALGISIVECLQGKYPFDRPQSYFDYLDTTKNTKDMLNGSRCSREAADFVGRCTETDPHRRPTAAELMEHPWIAGMQRDPQVFKAWMDGMDRVNSMNPVSVRSTQSIRSFLGKR